MIFFKRIPVRLVLFFVILVIAALYAFVGGSRFTPHSNNPEKMSVIVKYLASSETEGRLTGSSGNRKAMQFVISTLQSYGVLPAGDAGTYEQTFRLIVPQIDTQPVFTVGESNSSAPVEYTLYQDYNALPHMNGGGIDFIGELVLVGSDLFRVDQSVLENRIAVVDANQLQPNMIQHVISSGGKGILCCSDVRVYGNPNAPERKKSVTIFDKTDDAILVGYLSGAAYQSLQSIAKETKTPIIPDVRLQLNMTFPIIETANIVGILPGNPKTDRVLMISANLDGLGAGTNGQVFGGAVKEAAGVAAALEIARLLSEQQHLPYQKIVFVFWNGQQQENAGTEYYLSHPLFPLEKTTLIHLDALGYPSLEGLQILADNQISAILKDKFALHARDLGLMGTKAGPLNSVIRRFVDKDVPAISLSETEEKYPFSTYLDTPDKIELTSLQNAVDVAIGYISRELYFNPLLDYLNSYELVFLLILIMGAALNMFITHRFENHPAERLLGMTGEGFYYQLPVVLLRKFYERVLPYLIVLFFLAFLVNVRQTTDVRVLHGEVVTNFSLYVTLKQTILYLRSLMDLNEMVGQQVGNILIIIKDAGIKSVALIGTALGIAWAAGLLSGLIESYRVKPRSMSALGSLLLFSIPDVFVVLLGLFAYTFAFRQYPWVADIKWLKGFALPVLALALIPSVYVTRMTVVAIGEELKKDYARAAKAVGYSRMRIFATELLPSVLLKLVDALPTLITMIFSNMIVVEYLFNYNGIGYFLLYLYKRQDIERFVPLAIALGLIYAVFVSGLKIIGKTLNPAKREVSR